MLVSSKTFSLLLMAVTLPVNAEAAFKCKDSSQCPQYRCAPGPFCPVFICVDDQCEVVSNPTKCEDSSQCPQIACVPGMVCNPFQCLDGVCYQPKVDEPETCEYTFPATATSQFVHGLCTKGSGGASASSTDKDLTYSDGGTFKTGTKLWGDRNYKASGIEGDAMCEDGDYLIPSKHKQIDKGTVVTVEAQSKSFELCTMIESNHAYRDGDWEIELPKQGFTVSEAFNWEGRKEQMMVYCKEISCETSCPEEMPGFNTGCSFKGKCKYGKETCCDGTTHDSIVMECQDGVTRGYNTDACLAIKCEKPETCEYTFPATATSQFVHGLCTKGPGGASASSTDKDLTYSDGGTFKTGTKLWGDRNYKASGIDGDAMCEGGDYLIPSKHKQIDKGTVVTVEAEGKSFELCTMIESNHAYRDGDWEIELPKQGFTVSEAFNWEGRKEQMEVYCKQISCETSCPDEMPGFNTGCSFEGKCKYGKETCCDGTTHDSIVMECQDGVTRGYNTDACLAIKCEKPCPEDAFTCKDGTVVSRTGPKCKFKCPKPVICTQDVKTCEDGTVVGRTGPKCKFKCPKPVICPQDVKTCEDGTVVGRTGPKCEFKCPEPVVCPQDVKTCEDGTVVGRTGPKCEFKCPEPVVCPQDVKTCEDGTVVGRTGPKCEFVCPEPGAECKESRHCPQPRCAPGQDCPVFVCVDNQCEAVSNPITCKDDSQCPQIACVPEMVCHPFQCVEYLGGGVCYQPKDDKPETSCPDEMPGFNARCSFEGSCKYGKETCCDGTTHDSIVMECHDGVTRGSHTDACFAITCEKPEKCSKDAFTCDDGTVVGRSGPKCEFKCPDDSVVVRTPPPPGGKGSSSGDPHFKLWTGDKFDYHGECDLVLVDNASFANGLGLKLHIRTTRVKYFSFIETVALQIGSDVLEFNNDIDNFLINGKPVGENKKHHKTLLGGFVVRRDPKAISIRLADGTGLHQKTGAAKIDFVHRRNGFPAVIVDGGNSDVFKGSLGLLGEWGTGRTLARDGKTVIEVSKHEATQFALEWQVRDNEPMLFQEARFPQFPTVCLPPAEMADKRLGASHWKKKAEEACAHWKEDAEECEFDVMATQDVLVAEEGHHDPMVVHVE